VVTSIASSYRLYKAPRSFHLVKSTKQCESALFFKPFNGKITC